MTEFRFQNTTYLFLLLALPLAHLLVSRFHLNARERLLRFVALPNLETLLKEKGGGGGSRKQVLFWLGLCFLILALARPQGNPIVEEMEGASLDIYVLLDVSRSMDAEDVPPSRLAKAKRSVSSLMQLLSGDRVGVVAFAGTAVLISPLTADYEVIRTFLQNVDSSLIQNQGTDITNALAVAEEAMKRGAERTGESAVRSNVFIVMSDGEDHASQDWEVVDRIQKEGGTIFSIAFGTEAGGPIPIRSDRGELSGHKRDRQGNQVKTSVQTKSLEEIARRGGGQFYFSTMEEGEIRDILNRMQGLDRANASLMRAKIYQEYFWPVLALAALCLTISFFSLRSAFRGIKPGRVAAFLLFLPAVGHANPLSLFWNSERRAFQSSQDLAQEGKPEEAAGRLKGLLAENPDNPELNFDLGTYLIEAKKYEEARQQLQRLLKNGNPLREEALFNIAGSYAEEKKKDEARGAYAEAIRTLQTKAPRTEEDEALLDMAKRNLARLAEESSGGQGGGGQQNQDQNKDQDPKNQGENQSKDNKPQDGKSGEDNKDGKDPQKKDEQGQNGQDKKDEESKEEKPEDNKDQGEGEGDKKDPPQPKGMRPGRKGFKEKGDMPEEDAKRILETLKQRETGLQKKFMRQQNKGNNRDDDGNKDW